MPDIIKTGVARDERKMMYNCCGGNYGVGGFYFLDSSYLYTFCNNFFGKW